MSGRFCLRLCYDCSTLNNAEGIFLLAINTPNAYKQACIDAYTAAGLVLFPLSFKREPMAPGWQFTMETVDELPFQFGLKIPADVFVLDYDPRLETTANKDQLKRFSSEIYLPPTFTVATPRGGLHLYYRIPGEKPFTKFPGSVRGFKAIEIKKSRQFVVAAGSHVDTGKYTGWYKVVDELSPSNIAYATPAMIEALRPIKAQPVEPTTATKYDTEQSQMAFIAYCETVDTATSAFAVACFGRDKGLTAATIAIIMFDYLNPRWSEQTTYDELLARAQNAYRYGQNSPGAKNYSEDFKTINPHEYGEKAPDGTERNLKKDVPDQEGKQPYWDWDFIKGVQVLRPNMHNTMCHFELPEIRTTHDIGLVPNPIHKMLAYNQFTNKLEFLKPAPWHQESIPFWRDVDALMLKDWLFREQFFRINKMIIEEAVEVVAQKDQYHPVKSWLDSLVWDGKPRVLTHYKDIMGCADTAYLREVAKCFFVGAVDRVQNPGCKHDTMVVLEGKQGIGKSMYVGALGGEYSTALTIDVHNPKNNLHRMIGKWIIEIPEMEFTRWGEADMKAVKAFLSVQVDNERLSYERHARNISRQSVFIGTMNPDEGGYLRDATGNRRFHPLRCRFVDLDRLKAEREQLFAEAMVMWREGAVHYLTDQTALWEAGMEQTKRQFTDLWEDVVYAVLQENPGKVLWQNTEIAFACHMPVSKHDQKVLHRLSNIMIKLGYTQIEAFNEKNRRVMKHWIKESGMGEVW